MARRPPIHTLDQSGASDGQAMVWSNALNMWVPATISGGGAASSVTFTPTGGISSTDVQAALAELDTEKAPLASPTFTGDPKAPTPTAGDNDVSIATTAFVQAAITALIGGAPGALDTLKELADAINDDASFAATVTTALAAKAPLASPVFTGNPTGPTPALGDNDLSLATTAFVQAAVNAGIIGAPALLIPPLKSGTYYSNPFASGSNTTALTAGAIELHPFPIPFACTLDRIGAEVTVTNAAGRLRLGIYASDANGNPSTLVFDAGQVTSVAGGAREITISQAMTPGQYWLACLGDVVGGTWRTWGATPVAAVLGFSGIVAGSAFTRIGTTGVATGALPASAPATAPIAGGTGGFRIFARAA